MCEEASVTREKKHHKYKIKMRESSRDILSE